MVDNEEKIPHDVVGVLGGLVLGVIGVQLLEDEFREDETVDPVELA